RPDAEWTRRALGGLGELVDLDLRGDGVEVDREEGVVHAETEEILERLGVMRRVDAERRARVERGAEERDALDVVPVQVRDEEVEIDRGVPVLRELNTELAQAGAGVEHEQRVAGRAYLDARRVAAVAHRLQAGRRDRAARAPEADPHPLPPVDAGSRVAT